MTRGKQSQLQVSRLKLQIDNRQRQLNYTHLFFLSHNLTDILILIINNILTWQSWYDRRVKKFLAYDTSSQEINKVRKSASHSSFFLVFLPLLNVVLGLKETPYLFVEGGRSGRNLFVGRATMKLGFVMNVISLYISETCLRIWEFVAGGHVLQLNYWHWNNSHLFQRRVRFRLTVTSLVARLTACSSTKISSDTGELVRCRT